MDIIFIDKLVVFAKIGIYSWEKLFPQKLIFNFKLGFKNLSKKRIDEENIKNLSFVDYTSVVNIVHTLIDKKKYMLIEQLAEDIAKELIKIFKILWIQVQICKPCAIPQAEGVGILIERWKEEKDVVLKPEF